MRMLSSSMKLCRRVPKAAPIFGETFVPYFYNIFCATLNKPAFLHQHFKSAQPSEVLVYEGSMRKLLMSLKFMSLNTSALTLLFSPHLLKVAESLPLAANVLMGLVLSAFTLNPFLIHLLSKRYVLTLTHDPTSGVFNYTTFKFVPPFTAKHSFELGQVEIPGGVPSIFTTIKVKGRPLFLAPENFSDRSVYLKLMKYDQPIDLSKYVNKRESL